MRRSHRSRSQRKKQVRSTLREPRKEIELLEVPQETTIIDYDLVMDGNILTVIREQGLDSLSRPIKREKPKFTETTDLTITDRIREGVIRLTLWIKGVLTTILLRIRGVREPPTDPVLEEFKRFSLLHKIYCTEDMEELAYHSAFGKAYYELREAAKTGNHEEYHRIFKEFMDTFLW